MGINYFDATRSYGVSENFGKIFGKKMLNLLQNLVIQNLKIEKV